MKIQSYILAYILSMLFLTSCSDQTKYSDKEWIPSHDAKYLSINPSSLIFEAKPSTQSTMVSSMNTPWRIDGTCPWVSFSQIDGKSDVVLDITVTKNTDPILSRNVMYNFMSSDSAFPYTKMLSITQESPGYEIVLSENTVTAIASPSQYTITVDANSTWTCKSDVSWIHLNVEDNKIIISCDENSEVSNEDRIGHIDVICGNAIATITVNQQPQSISVKTDEILYEAEGGVFPLNIKSNTLWSASSSQSWINVSPSEGDATTSILYISATPNNAISERQGNVYISIKDQLVRIPIRQKGLFFDVDKTSLTFDKQASTQTIEIKTNTTWEVISKPDFIDAIVPTNGSSSTTLLNISAKANQIGDRNGSIVLGNPSITGLTKTISIYQSGYEFNTSETNISFTAYVTRLHEISIASNTSWTISSNAEWLHASPAKGSGNDKIQISADINPSVSQRTANIKIIPDAVLTPIDLNITQSGQTFTISSDKLIFTSKGGSNSISVNIDGESLDVKTPSWLDVSSNKPNVGEPVRLSFNASEHKGDSERQGEIIISLKNLPDGETFERKISVVQYPYLQRIGKDVFDEDNNWNLGGDNTLTISVNGFGSDSDWNISGTGNNSGGNNDNSNLSIKVTGFGTDLDWNLK